MATLTYWVCESLNDASCYSIRAKTRKEAVRMRDSYGDRSWEWSEAEKVTVKYSDGFDLLTQCLEEGGGCWE